MIAVALIIFIGIFALSVVALVSAARRHSTMKRYGRGFINRVRRP